MEESCLLCLEERKNYKIVDGIKANTMSWHELNIKEIIEKHFWPLNDILLSYTWLCLRCWQEVKDFHEFYVRIEKAQQNADKLKSIKQELPSFGYLEPEILINEPLATQDKEDIKIELPLDEPNFDYEPSKQLPANIKSVEDPLERCEHNPIIKENKTKHIADDEMTVKNVDINSEPEDTTEYTNSNSNSDFDMDDVGKDADYIDNRAPSKRARTCKKRAKQYKDNDLFIMENFKQMFCDLCQVKFEDFPGMQKHFIDVHKQVGYLVCCSRKFYHRYRLVDHIHIHLNPDHFKCDQCGKVLSDRVKLKSHILSVHRPNDPELKHYCEVCGKLFINHHVLRRHKLTHLPEEEKKFPCSDCGKHYGSASSLKVHREVVHLNKLAKICYICGLTLRNNAAYKAHMNKHEGITTDVNCDICGLRVTSEKGLKVHKESQHPVGGKREHKCTLCPKVSPTLSALKKHFNTMHVKGYEYKCTLCERAFKRQEALKEHMASHTGTSLYTCPWCPKTFNSNANMHSHRKKMHPIEWEEAKLQKYVGKECLNAGNNSNRLIHKP